MLVARAACAQGAHAARASVYFQRKRAARAGVRCALFNWRLLDTSSLRFACAGAAGVDRGSSSVQAAL